MKKLFFLTSLLFAEEVSIAAKYPLIYEAMQTEQGANNLVGITENNYEAKTKDMKENIFMQPAKNIIWFNDFVPWNPIFVVKIGNHYVPFFKKFSCTTYILIATSLIIYFTKINNRGHLGAIMLVTIITFILHIIESVATTYYSMIPIKTEEQLLKTLSYNLKKNISLTFFTINILLFICLIFFNIIIFHNEN